MLQLSLLSAFKIEPYVRMHMCTSVRSYHQSFKPHDNRAAKCPSELTVTGVSCAFCPDNNPIPNRVFPFEVSKEFLLSKYLVTVERKTSLLIGRTDRGGAATCCSHQL